MPINMHRTAARCIKLEFFNLLENDKLIFITIYEIDNWRQMSPDPP